MKYPITKRTEHLCGVCFWFATSDYSAYNNNTYLLQYPESCRTPPPPPLWHHRENNLFLLCQYTCLNNCTFDLMYKILPSYSFVVLFVLSLNAERSLRGQRSQVLYIGLKAIAHPHTPTVWACCSLCYIRILCTTTTTWHIRVLKVPHRKWKHNYQKQKTKTKKYQTHLHCRECFEL